MRVTSRSGPRCPPAIYTFSAPAATVLVRNFASRSTVEQAARVILEPHARDSSGAHGDEHARDLEGRVGVTQPLGTDIGDAIALRVGRVRMRLKGQICAHAVGRREPW